jgi:hypothetical protein
LKPLIAFELNPLKTNLCFCPVPTTTSSEEVNNSSNLPTILLIAGFLVEIPDSLAMIAKD